MDKVVDMGASGSDSHPPHPPPIPGHEGGQPLHFMGHEAQPAPTRKDAIMACLENPILPDPTLLRLDHISALLALLLEGPYRSTTIDLLYKCHIPEESIQI